MLILMEKKKKGGVAMRYESQKRNQIMLFVNKIDYLPVLGFLVSI